MILSKSTGNRVLAIKDIEYPEVLYSNYFVAQTVDTIDKLFDLLLG